MIVFVKVYIVLASAVLVDNSDLFSVRIAPSSGVKPHSLEKWWGPTHLRFQNDTAVRPFKITFHPEMIQDLRYRLLNHRPLTPPLEGVGFQYGFNTYYLESWVDYWANEYDFSAREAYLNQFPQFTTNILGLNIHFLWVKPQVPPHVKVLPLLLLHGFPGSVVEFYKAIPLLKAHSKHRDFAVEVIAPSLPGYGFSDGAVRPGLGAPEMAVIFKKLMHRLGFNKFYVQGGDWGSVIGLSMATLYPEDTLGFHTNLAVALHPNALALLAIGTIYPCKVVDPAVADRIYPIMDQLIWLITESGYFHIQATKPDSIGVAMADSPTGLLAYIFQLMSSASRRKYVERADGGLEELYTRDELLDNLMMYWATNSFTTAARIYAETANLRNSNWEVISTPTTVPTRTTHAKDEIIYQSPLMLATKYHNIINSTILHNYGHFLAFEAPEVFVKDVLKALDAFRSWDSREMFNI